MPSLREYFLTESADYLAQLERAAAPDAPDAGELLRAARALRGAAQMAREDRVRRVASALEVAAREAARGARPWDDDTRRRARDTVADLRALAQAGEADSGVAATAEQALARWREVGVAPEEVAPPAGAAQPGPSDEELRRYVATESRQVIGELERAIPALTRSPMGRDPLKSILRRQRALLGSAGLERFPVVAGTLQAIEDATRTVARQNLAVDGQWLGLYRQAHVVLNEAVARLEAGGAADPSTPAFVELRALRDRLIGARQDETPFQPPAPPAGSDAAELVGFFRTEASKLLDRVERMAGAFAAATEERRTQLRKDLNDALNALRDTSRTFGFEEPARAAEQALGRLAEAASTTLLETVERLREIIHAATDDTGTAAASRGVPAPVVTTSAASPGPAAPGAAARAAAPLVPGAPTPSSAPSAVPLAAGAAAAAAGAAVVPIEDLTYRGEAALRRALELRADLERAVAPDDRAARETLAELFDLVRLAMS
ncbi:MAG TPA: Hpt domain-containing protein [Terriglobales bacterium]|nr:Hpt domain-containing protein [Terriglobales bacterium]